MSNTKLPQNIHADHRNRMKDKYLEFGIAGFADHEILELLLFYAIPRKNVNPLAHKLLNHFGSFNSVIEADVDALMQVDGLGKNTAILISLIFKILHKYNLNPALKTKIVSASLAKAYCHKLYTEFNVEQFFVICINSAGKIMCSKRIGNGTANSIEINIREITGFALANKCQRIIITHSHTNEKCMPSDDDLTFTKTVMLSCLLNDIDILDHGVIARNCECSFAELNLINGMKDAVLSTIPSVVALCKQKKDLKYVIHD